MTAVGGGGGRQNRRSAATAAATCLALAAGLTAFVCAPGSVLAAVGGDEATADAAIRRGVDLRRQGKDQDALDEFRRAYAAAKTPRALAQIGLAEQALGRWVDAESDLDQAMATKSDTWIRKNVATLNGALDVIRRHLGSLEVIGPEGAELRVDGRVAGTLPLAKPARLAIGNLTVELRKPGFFSASRPVSINAGELTRETMELQRADAPPPPPVVAPTAKVDPPLQPIHGPGGAGSAGEGGGSLGGDGGHGGGEGTDTGDGRRAWQRPLAWSTAGAALLGGVVGGVAALLHDRDVKDANRLECNVNNDTHEVHPNDTANASRCQQLASGAVNTKLTSIVAFSAAGALAITSAILFATAPSRGAPASSARAGGDFTCAPTLATPGAVCQLRF